MKIVVMMGHDGMGHGDADLGRRILANFLRKSGALAGLEAICLYNSGVKLAANDSPVLTELTLLHEQGVEVMPCGTCVDHYGLRDKIGVGRICSMDEIIAELNRCEKSITL